MAQWSGEGLSQVDFMQKDECILLDMKDNVIGEERRPAALLPELCSPYSFTFLCVGPSARSTGNLPRVPPPLHATSADDLIRTTV